jgi:hypothetical protein
MPLSGGPIMRAPTFKDRIACAANYGDEKSLASKAGGGKSFLPNLVLGNVVSGIATLGLNLFANKPPTGQQIAIGVLSGAGQGLPGGGPGMKGPAGMAQDFVIEKAATQFVGEAAAEGVANVVGLVKFAYDGTSFLYGYFKECK